MEIREYLQQYELLDAEINQLTDEYTALSQQLDSIRNTEPQNNDRLARYEALEKEINELIDSKFEVRHRIIKDIHRLHNINYVTVLYKYYIELKSLKQIAIELNFAYNSIRHIQSRAIKELQRIIQE
jgi:predicted RNase H-like nuclease (RuvC/YqgF family)